MRRSERRWFLLLVEDRRRAFRKLEKMAVFDEILGKLRLIEERLGPRGGDPLGAFIEHLCKWRVRFVEAEDGGPCVPTWGKHNEPIPSLRIALLAVVHWLQKSEETAISSADPTFSDQEERWDPPGPSSEPLSAAVEELQEALSELPDRERDALEAILRKEETVIEVAARYGLTYWQIYHPFRWNRAALRKRLQETRGDPE